MRKNGQEGAITVFLSIILLVMIVLAGVIVDVARINTAKPQIKRAVETSVRSALAGYNMDLKEQYGLFALNQNNNEVVKEIIEYYLSKNLMIDKEYLNEKKIGDHIDLYDYEIESIEVEPLFNLTENPVTRQQILEYMKYRAPKEFAKGFIDKLELLKKAGTTSEAYKRKIDFEKELTSIDKFQQKVYKNIYGEYQTRILWSYRKGNLDYYVRKLDEDKFKSIVNDYVEEVLNYKDFKEELDDIEKEISRAKTEKKKEELRDKKRKIQRRIDETDEEIDDMYDKILTEISEYETVNRKAINSIDELAKNSKDVRIDLEKYKDNLAINQEQIMSEAFEDLMNEAKEYDKQIPYTENDSEGSNLNDIKTKLNENIEILNGANSSSIRNLVNEMDPSTAKKLDIKKLKSLKSTILDRSEDYNNDIQYDYTITGRDKSYEKYDNREYAQGAGNGKIDINVNNEDSKVIISDNKYSILPSVIMAQEERENIVSGIGFLWNTDDDKKIQGVEFHEEEKYGFGESSLSKLNEITKDINLNSIMDEIYINEYIIGTFKNYVSEATDEYTLRHIKKFHQNSYFERSEVEYILNGNKSEKINQTLMDSKILLTRFPLNSIHAFTCKEKNTIATSTAAAVAGWYTGGAGIPIIRTLILLGWSMTESVYDLQELKAGREVVIYKTEEDWITDLGSSVEKAIEDESKVNTDSSSSNKVENLMNTSYQDYLRFFLLVQNKDETMKRVQDLIQINMQKSTGDSDVKLKDFNTYVRVKVVVSIKYLFITQSFMPSEVRTENSRQRFNVEIYQGY